MSEYIEREAAKLRIFEYGVRHRDNSSISSACENLERQMNSIPAADVRPVPDGGIGEMSDGYHTFNGLYYQRMVLFAALVNAHKDKAWKSWKHEDGELCFGGGWFIVGIDTPQGSYTYHYEAKDFVLFDCEELPVAKHWDGHTEEDVTRLLSLDVRPVVKAHWKPGDIRNVSAVCSNCGHLRLGNGAEWATKLAYFCEKCGADMRPEPPKEGDT